MSKIVNVLILLLLAVAISAIRCNPEETSTPTPVPTLTPTSTLNASPSPTVPPYSPFPMYTQGEIDYFLDVVFGSEAGFAFDHIVKWHMIRDLPIAMVGNYTETDIQTLERVIDDINLLTHGEIEVQLVGTAPRITVDFVTTQAITKHLPPELSGYISHGHGDCNFVFDDQIVGCSILIANDVSQTRRNHVIREEVTQSIGLRADSHKYPDSIFYDEYSLIQDYSELDCKVVEMLYLPDISPGMTLDQVRKVLTQHTIQ